MLPCVVRRLGIFLAIVVTIGLSLPAGVVQAQQLEFSTNPDDYDFGWFTIGIHAPGSVPYCTYCVNALAPGYTTDVPAENVANGQFWNRTVALYRCEGVDMNEIWAYQDSTNSIVFANLTTGAFCVDAELWNSLGLLTLRQCNSSVATQRWTKDGNRLISGGLVDSTGQPLFMVGKSPNKEADPTNQVTTYPLMINSSVPSEIGTAFFYTANFTFLSTRNYIDKPTERFTTEGLLQITNSSRDAVINGGFESSTIQAGTEVMWSTWVQEKPNYLALCGWVIETGPIDYVKSGFLQPANGSSYSIHLNTHSDADHWGSVSQTFKTEPGREFVLSFSFNGFPPTLQITSRPKWKCSSSYRQARLQVGVTNATSSDRHSGALSDGDGFTQNFTLDVTSFNSINIVNKWETQIVMFTPSTNVTTISFASLNFNDSCGPMIDGVRVSPLEAPSPAKSKILLAIAAGIGGLAVLVAILGVIYGVRYCRNKADYSGLYKTEHARVYSVKELSVATKKFSSVLGDGGFGTVYKADFPDGSTGAVKVEKPKGLHHSSKVLASDEIAVLLRVHHRNLVNMIGFCIHKGRHMLVFEYLPNGSLYDRLHQSILHSPTAISHGSFGKSPPAAYSEVLSWSTRVRIVADVASGLDYLHNDADPPIVHRDVKSQNILLTSTDSAKLADFGLSKAAPAEATAFESIETMVRGSIGYLDPQYFLSGVFSPKSDVYSFGVVVLELISGHQAVYNAAPLATWAAPFMTSPSLYHDLVDKKLNGEFDANELESLVELSRMCMREDSKMRPNMRQVIAFLNTRKLAKTGEGAASAEWMDEAKLKECYNKINPMFIEFELEPDEDTTSRSQFLPLPGPQPRD